MGSVDLAYHSDIQQQTHAVCYSFMLGSPHYDDSGQQFWPAKAPIAAVPRGWPGKSAASSSSIVGVAQAEAVPRDWTAAVPRAQAQGLSVLMALRKILMS